MSREIPLTQGKVAIVDDDDYERVAGVRWCAVRTYSSFYAARHAGRGRVYMHRFLLSPAPGLEVDHIDGDGLNNQRSNMRVCTHAQNLANQRLSAVNTSGYRGVTWNKVSGKWQAQIKVSRRMHNLGNFVDITDAARARREAEDFYFGGFARRCG